MPTQPDLNLNLFGPVVIAFALRRQELLSDRLQFIYLARCRLDVAGARSANRAAK